MDLTFKNKKTVVAPALGSVYIRSDDGAGRLEYSYPKSTSVTVCDVDIYEVPEFGEYLETVDAGWDAVVALERDRAIAVRRELEQCRTQLIAANTNSENLRRQLGDAVRGCLSASADALAAGLISDLNRAKLAEANAEIELLKDIVSDLCDVVAKLLETEPEAVA